MSSTPEQLRFASIPAHRIRADFAGGGLSSDLGPMLLRGVDRQIGLFLDLDHSEDACHGQQPLAFYNHHYRSTCYLPRMIFDCTSGALVAAVLRPGKRPTGEENAMIMRRVLQRIRLRWPDTHIVVRGDGHFSGPELMGLIDSLPNVHFLFGFSANVKLLAMAEQKSRRGLCSCSVKDKASRCLLVITIWHIGIT